MYGWEMWQKKYTIPILVVLLNKTPKKKKVSLYVQKLGLNLSDTGTSSGQRTKWLQ